MSEHIVFWSEARKRYMLKYKTASGWKPKSAPKEIKTQKAAEFWAEQWLASERAKSASKATGSVLGATVADKWEAWIELRKGRSKRTATHKDDASHFRHHLLPFLGRDLIGAITVARVRELVRKLKEKRGRNGKGPLLSGLKIRNILQTLRLFLDDAKAEGWGALESNPARDPAVQTEMPAAERKSGKVLYLTVEAMQAVLDHPDVSAVHKLQFLLGTLGLRAGELAALRFAKVRLDDTVPHLVVDVAVVTRSETGWAQEGEVKSEASERRVPLPTSYAAALRWWKKEGWALTYGGSAPADTATLFPGRTRELARPRVAEHLRQDLARAGQATHHGPHAFTFHHLRHSCATWLDEAGVDEPTIGALLGHEGKSVTRKSYTAATLTRLAEAAAKIPLRWNQGLGSIGSGGTNRAPLDLAKTLHERVLSVVKSSDSRHVEPNEASGSDFVNRRSPVQARKVAPGFWGAFGSIGTKNGTKTAPLTPRSDWALSALRRVS